MSEPCPTCNDSGEVEVLNYIDARGMEQEFLVSEFLTCPTCYGEKEEEDD